MSEYQDYSPQSPNPADNEGIPPLVLERERKMHLLNEQEVQYQLSIENYELAVHRHQLAEHKTNSTRSAKRRRACQGCNSKWCGDCNLESAAKKMRTAADNMSETMAELADIEERIKNGPTITRNRIGSESTDNNNDDVKEEPEVKDEADVKQENDDGTYAPTIGIVNAVKSEPSDDYPTTTDNSDDSDTDVSDDATNDSETDNASADDTDSYTNDDYDDTEDSESIQAQYPSTPSQTDTDENTDDNSEAETNDDTEDELSAYRNELSAFRKFMNRL